MRRVLTLFLIGVGVLLLRTAAPAADWTPQQAAQEAETAFRSAMQAWAYDEYWRLWDMGSRASRAVLSREQFTERMQNGTSRPAAGKQVEAIQVASISPDSGTVQVRFGLEDKRRPWAESTERLFFLKREDGEWKVSLWDFVGLANYFPPDFFQGRPLSLPPPSTPKRKGLME